MAQTTQMRRVLSLETLPVNDSGAVTKRGAKADLRLPAHVYGGDGAVEDTAFRRGQEACTTSSTTLAMWWSMRDELGYGQFVKFEAGVDNKPTEISKLRKVVVNQLRKIDFSGQWTGSSSADQGFFHAPAWVCPR